MAKEDRCVRALIKKLCSPAPTFLIDKLLFVRDAWAHGWQGAGQNGTEEELTEAARNDDGNLGDSWLKIYVESQESRCKVSHNNWIVRIVAGAAQWLYCVDDEEFSVYANELGIWAKFILLTGPRMVVWGANRGKQAFNYEDHVGQVLLSPN